MATFSSVFDRIFNSFLIFIATGAINDFAIVIITVIIGAIL